MRRLLLAILLWAGLAPLAFAQVCPGGSTCATLDSYIGAHLSLGGALTTTQAITTSGTGAATFALGNSTATYTFQGTDTYVGRATTDTLTNKTLTSPTIAAGALSGTFSGTPTFSGNLTFSGAPILTGLSAGTIAAGKNLGLDASNNLVTATVSGGGTGANPTATASDVAVNGVATTFLRSDGAPPIQKCSTSNFGLCKPDGSTITVSAGVISAVSGGAGTVTNNGNLTTHAPIIGGTNGTTDVKSLAALTNGQLAIGSTGADPVGALPTGTGGITIAGSAGGLAIGNTPVIYVGATAGSANTYTIASPTPSGFTLTDQYIVCGSISAANTGDSTLAVNGTTATHIKKQTPAGLALLSGGELVASNTQYCFQYSVAGTAYVLLTQLGSGVTSGATSATVSAAQWANWQIFVVTTSSQTLTLPVVTGLATNGGVVIITRGNAVTLAPNSADGINGGTINTSVTIPANYVAVVTTSGSSGTGALNVPLGLAAGTNITLTPNSDGTTTVSAAGGGSGAFTLIQTLTASNSATLSWTSLDTTTYHAFQLKCLGLVAGTGGGQGMELYLTEGGTKKTTGYTTGTSYIKDVTGGAVTFSNGTAGFMLTNGINNAAGDAADFTADFSNWGSSTQRKNLRYTYEMFNTANGNGWNGNGFGSYTADTNAADGIVFQLNTGNIASGECSLFGYTH